MSCLSPDFLTSLTRGSVLDPAGALRPDKPPSSAIRDPHFAFVSRHSQPHKKSVSITQHHSRYNGQQQ